MLDVGRPDACSEHDTDVLRQPQGCNKGARFRDATHLTEDESALGTVALIIARRGESPQRSPSCVRRSVHNQPVSFQL